MAVRQRGAAGTKAQEKKTQDVSPQGVSDSEERSKATPSSSPARIWIKVLSGLVSLACLIYVARSLLFDGESNLQPPSKTTTAKRLPYELAIRPIAKHPVFDADEEKLQAVLEAFDDSWAGYVEDAFGFDEYHPLTKEGSNFSKDGGVGYFIVDVLDMLLLTERRKEYERARDWVRDELRWSDKSAKFSVFETTIRTLGGLLSAHALCGGSDPSQASPLCAPSDADLFLEKALDLAEHLRPAFEATKTGMPLREVDFATGEVFADVDNNGAASLAEVATVQLEFKYLAHLTGDDAWWHLAERPMQALLSSTRQAGLEGILPIFISPSTAEFYMSEIRLGSRGDSYYEYLIKQYLQTNRTESIYNDMYRGAVQGIKRRLIKTSKSRKPPLLFVAEIGLRRLSPQDSKPSFVTVPKQDHLVCFIGGSLMLGAVYSGDPRRPGAGRPEGDFHTMDASSLHRAGAAYPPSSLAALSRLSATSLEDWSLGSELTKTCVTTYRETSTGLSPEIAMFRQDGDGVDDRLGEDWYIKKSLSKWQPLIDARNILRPETVESLYIAFHLTGDPIYRQWGWEIFTAFRDVARVPDGHKSGRAGVYAGISDVNADPKDPKFLRENKMETFWLAETLKYLYLLFASQDKVPLDRWVFNTEAHPLPVFEPHFETHVS